MIDELNFPQGFISIPSENIFLYPFQGVYNCDKVFQNGPSKICGRQPLKNLKEYSLPKALIHYLIHSWILSPNCNIVKKWVKVLDITC